MSDTTEVPDVRSFMDSRYTLTGTSELYEGKFTHLELETYLGPNGEPFAREIVKKGDVVGMLLVHAGSPVHGSLTGTDHVILLDQFRCGARNSILEIPAGTVDEGEDPLTTAIREAYEEVGAICHNMKYMTSLYTSPGWTDELCHLFYCKLYRDDMKDRSPQGVEEVHSSLAYLTRMDVRENLTRFKDAKTLAALMFWLEGKLPF